LAGVPKGNPHHTGTAEVDLFPNAWPTEMKAKPPPPPFLVPAVIDALRASPKFGSLVKLVPGEADGFCAEHVQNNGGTVLTSDSDLLVYDLGENGGVVFFTDVDIDAETQRLIAPQYRPADLCRRLSINSETGLQHLAFEVSWDSHLTLEQAVEKAKRSEAVSAFPEEYSKFIEQYLSPEVAGLKTDQVSVLDPRISEIVLRSLRVSEDISQAPGDKKARQVSSDAELTMYLPFLLDCPSRTSAWEASKPVRQLAYAVLQSIQDNNISAVFEMRRLQTVSLGLRIDVPAPSEIHKLAVSLLALLGEIEAAVGKVERGVWVMLAMYQDIAMIMDRGKGHPLSLDILNQQARGKLDLCSWDFLHSLAQTQATYYSLRMLRQVLDLSAQHSKHMVPLSDTMSRLAKYLSNLPALPDFPSPSTYAETLKVLGEAEGLSCLETICAEHESVILPLIELIRKPQNNKKSKKRKATPSAQENTRPRPRSSNPFDLLTGSEE
jgi:hypothetical protein